MNNVDLVVWGSLFTTVVALVIIVYLYVWVWRKMGEKDSK